MSPELVEPLLLFLAGVVTGVLGAMLGTGGGVLLIPVLVIGFDVPIHHAVAASLVTVIATSTAVASVNVQRQTVNMPLGMTLEMATVTGAILGGLTAAWLTARTLEGVFAAMLVPTAWLMWRGRGESSTKSTDTVSATASATTDGGNPSPGPLDGQYFDEATSQTINYRLQRLWAGMGVGLFAGGASGLLGIGGGTFKVPALNLLCGVPIKAAAATSNFMIGVTAAASAFLYFGRGDVQSVITAACVLGILVGSVLGTRANRRIKGRVLQRLFAVLLIAVAIEMSLRAAGIRTAG